ASRGHGGFSLARGCCVVLALPLEPLQASGTAPMSASDPTSARLYREAWKAARGIRAGAIAGGTGVDEGHGADLALEGCSTLDDDDAARLGGRRCESQRSPFSSTVPT